MTVDKNDSRNWIVARLEKSSVPGSDEAILSILATDQAENKARELAESSSLVKPGEPVFLYQRVGIVVTEPKARWQ